jgi:beta-glucanase (GH16 family)
MVNPGLPGDTMPFVTGGVFTKNKKGFHRGKIEISAKFSDAQGAWPAFWLLPFDNTPWPYGGEIDIMERLNGDGFVHLNIHSYYTNRLRQREPKTSATAPIRNGGFNTYGIELYPDSVVHIVNEMRYLTYPRIETDLDGQFPFDRPFYLLLDMQLGGSWVGEVNPDDLPGEMYIDWVKFYEWK